MTEALVVDSNVLIAHFSYDDPHHLKAEPYISGLERGHRVFHIPTLAIVEICAVIGRRVSAAVALAARRRMEAWAKEGRVILYALDEKRASASSNVAIEYRLNGADAVFAGLAEELGMNLITFDDKNLARRYPRAVVPA